MFTFETDMLSSSNLAMNHIEGLLAVKRDEERSGNAVAEPAEEKDLAEAQEAEDGCGKG